MAQAGAANRKKKTPAARKRQRQARNAKCKIAIAGGGGLGGELGNAPMMSGGFVGRSEFVPNENFEPSVPATTAGFSLPEAVMLGDTPNGQAWAIKALHPNVETVTAAAGIPDHTSVPVVTPEFRVNHIITGSGGTGEGLDDLDIIVIGASDLAFIYRRYDANKTPVNDQWIPVYFPGTGPSVRQVLAYPTDPGNTKTIGITAGFMGEVLGKARGMYGGFTLVHDAPMTRDEGRIVAAQLGITETASLIRSEVALFNTTGTTEYSEQDMNSVSLGNIPFTEDELFQASPGAIVHEVRDGIYMPLRFRDPVHIFNEVQNAKSTDKSRDGLVPAVLVYYRAEDNKYVTLRGGDPFPTKGLRVNIGTECVLNFLTGVILIRGMSKQANLSAKMRIGVQGMVVVASPLSSFQHEAPLLDQKAIDMVTKMGQEMPMAFPAYYNDSNALMGLIKALLPHLGSLLGALGIPGGGAIGTLVGGLLGAPGRKKKRNQAAGVKTMMAALRARRR